MTSPRNRVPHPSSAWVGKPGAPSMPGAPSKLCLGGKATNPTNPANPAGCPIHARPLRMGGRPTTTGCAPSNPLRCGCHPERTGPQTFSSGVPNDRSSSLGWRLGVVSRRICCFLLFRVPGAPIHARLLRMGGIATTRRVPHPSSAWVGKQPTQLTPLTPPGAPSMRALCAWVG